MSNEIENAMNVLKKAFNESPDYAYGWHANIAMSCYDAQMDKYKDVVDSIHDDIHKISNDAASRFMKICFDAETSSTMLLDSTENKEVEQLIQ